MERDAESQGNVPVLLTYHSCILWLVVTFHAHLTSSWPHLTPAMAQADSPVGIHLLHMDSTSPQKCTLFLMALERQGFYCKCASRILQLPSHLTQLPFTPLPLPNSVFRAPSPWVAFPISTSFSRALCLPLLSLATDSFVWSFHYKSLYCHIIYMIY